MSCGPGTALENLLSPPTSSPARFQKKGPTTFRRPLRAAGSTPSRRRSPVRSNLDHLLQLPTESVTSLLQRLSDQREQQRSIPAVALPRVTLPLRSGLDLTG